MRRATLALLLLGCLGPATALAQEEPSPVPEPEIPDVPRPSREASAPAAEKVPRYTKADYPTEVILRPMTLAELQVELSHTLVFVANSGNSLIWSIEHGAFGITPDWEVGFTWAPFLSAFDPPPGGDGFKAGRGFSIDGAWTAIPDWLAIRLKLAFYADPDVFGFGLVIGAPFRWRILPRLALFVGEDLLYIKVAKLAVDPADPTRNVAEVANLVRQIPTAAGRINLSFGAIWQITDFTAMFGNFAIGWEDFSFTDQPYSLYAGVTHAISRQIDVGARLGFRRLDDSASFTFSASFGLRL